MKRLLVATAALSALAVAMPASAQVLGGVTGGVQGSVGGQVTTPNVGAAVGQTVDGVRGTVNDGRDMTRDTVRDARDAVNDSRPTAGVDADVDASGSAAADRSGAEADFNVSSGAMVHASDGAMLGNVVRVTRNAAGRAEGFVVRSADGAVRYVPAAGARVEGDVVVSGWSRSEFESAPRQNQ